MSQDSFASETPKSAKDEMECYETIEEEFVETDSMIFRRHLRYEAETLKQLLKLEGRFREHFELMKKEFHQQKDVVERMSFLAQRYTMIISTGTNCCKYPEVYAMPAENTILSEYSAKLTTLRESNAIVLQSLAEVREECRVFEKLYDHLNDSFVTDFMVGDSFHKPISYFYELVRDLFNYLHTTILKLKIRVSSMDPLDFGIFTEYKKLLDISFDFEEYLKKGFVYCKCLQPRSVCVVKRTILHAEDSSCKM